MSQIKAQGPPSDLPPFFCGWENTERIKSSHFDQKSWVTGRTKIWLMIPSNWRIFESKLLDIECQSISQYRVNFTRNIGSIWLAISGQFDSQYRVNLTCDIGSIWLAISGQFDSQYRINLTRNIGSIWFKYSPITQNSGSNFSSATDSTF